MGDLIFLEILQGFRNDKEFNRAKRTLATLDQYELFGTHMVDKCAYNYRFLRKKGRNGPQNLGSLISASSR
jgi:hypothetical protein